MSISGISSNTYLYELYFSQNSSTSSSRDTAQFKQDKGSDPLKADLVQLWQALQSGNLTNAQSIFSQLQSDVQALGSNTPVQAATGVEPADSTGTNPLADDFSALGSALDSEDVEGAQEILATIMQHMQPPGGSPPSASGPEDGSDTITDELNALGQALLSGDLAGAQSIFTQLQSDIQAIGAGDNDTTVQDTTGTVSAGSDSTNPLAGDFSALEDALESNDITSAKEYLLKIIQHLLPPGGPDMSSQLDILT